MNMKPSDSMEVRPRSTRRKARGDGAPASRKAPSQARSMERREKILDAAEALLMVADIENLSLSDVGRRAEMSKASVHYHFPTVAALQLELGRRHDRQLRALYNSRARENQGFDNWQQWMRVEASVARDYFARFRPACETLLGPILHRQNRLEAKSDNAHVGLQTLEILSRFFELPNVELLKKALPFYGEIVDVFWSGAYLTHGYIDDESFDESMRAGISYLRNFLPDVLTPREAGMSLHEQDLLA